MTTTIEAAFGSPAFYARFTAEAISTLAPEGADAAFVARVGDRLFFERYADANGFEVTTELHAEFDDLLTRADVDTLAEIPGVIVQDGPGVRRFRIPLAD